MVTIPLTSRPAEPERHDPKVGQSQPCASTWDWERAYTGPPEDGQPRMGSARPLADRDRRSKELREVLP